MISFIYFQTEIVFFRVERERDGDYSFSPSYFFSVRVERDVLRDEGEMKLLSALRVCLFVVPA